MMGSQGPNSTVSMILSDSETVLLCKADGQRWYLDCLVSGTERQNYPVRGKVILESPHSVCWRKISADKCSLRAFYPQCGRQPSITNVVALLRKRISYKAWALWCVCCRKRLSSRFVWLTRPAVGCRGGSVQKVFNPTGTSTADRHLLNGLLNGRDPSSDKLWKHSQRHHISNFSSDSQ